VLRGIQEGGVAGEVVFRRVASLPKRIWGMGGTIWLAMLFRWSFGAACRLCCATFSLWTQWVGACTSVAAAL